jgi:ABC-type lipoprotein release transport system permease subunit
VKLSKLNWSLSALFCVLCLPSLVVGLEPACGRQSQHSVIEVEALAAVAGKSRGTLVFGIEAECVSALRAVSGIARNGPLNEFERGEGAFVSARLSQQLSINPSDDLTLVYPTGQSTPMGLMPLIVRYRVLGIVDGPLLNADGEAVYIRRIDAKTLSKPST